MKIQIGDRFDRLVVLEQVDERKRNNIQYLCLCDCGEKSIVVATRLIRGVTTSCGCKRRENLKTHGLSNLPEYNNWCLMKARCNNKNHPRYKEWGGNGVRVCKEWSDSFEAFLNDMGTRPEGFNSIDRIDSSKGYSIENCRWANNQIQSENRVSFVRRIEFLGEFYTISALARKFNVDREMLKYRLKIGWSIHDAINVKSGDKRV